MTPDQKTRNRIRTALHRARRDQFDAARGAAKAQAASAFAASRLEIAKIDDAQVQLDSLIHSVEEEISRLTAVRITLDMYWRQCNAMVREVESSIMKMEEESVQNRIACDVSPNFPEFSPPSPYREAAAYYSASEWGRTSMGAEMIEHEFKNLGSPNAATGQQVHEP